MIDQLLLNGLDILRDSAASQQTQTSDWPDASDGQADRPVEENDNPIQSILKLLAEFLDSEVCSCLLSHVSPLSGLNKRFSR